MDPTSHDQQKGAEVKEDHRIGLTDIVHTAIQDRLVRSQRLADLCQRRNDPQPQPLPLDLLIDSDIFDVSDETEATQELPLHEDRSGRDDLVVLLVHDSNDDIRRREAGMRYGLVDGAKFVEVSGVGFVARCWRGGQHGQHGEVRATHICGGKRTNLEIIKHLVNNDFLQVLRPQVNTHMQVLRE